MARKSDISGRGPLFGNHRSHAMNANRRRWNLNLQTKFIFDQKTGKKIKVKLTAAELRTLQKTQK